MPPGGILGIQFSNSIKSGKKVPTNVSSFTTFDEIDKIEG